MQSIKLFNHENEREGQWLNRFAETVNADVRLERAKIGFHAANGVLFGAENILVIYFAAQLALAAPAETGAVTGTPTTVVPCNRVNVTAPCVTGPAGLVTVAMGVVAWAAARRWLGIAAVVVACAVPLVAFTAVAISDRGIGGTINDRVDELTSETDTAPTEGAGSMSVGRTPEAASHRGRCG